MPHALQVNASSPNGAGGVFTPLSATPLTTLTYSGPVSSDSIAIGFEQSIAADDPLRTGNYSKTLTFALSTTSP
jgi:hypothetical protein